MRAVAKIIALLLLVPYGWAEESGAKYYSDQEYKKLQSYAAPSNFYPEGNSGQLELLIMCIDRGDVAVFDRLLNAVPTYALAEFERDGNPGMPCAEAPSRQ